MMRSLTELETEIGGKSTTRHNMYSLPGEHIHYRRRTA